MKIFKNSRFAVSLIFAINGMVFGTWASRIPAIVDFHDLSPGSLGLLIFLAGLSAVIAFSIFGRAADRYGAAFITKRATLLLIPLTLIFIAYANSIWMLVFAVIFFGTIHGGDDVAMNAWAAEVEREYARPVMSSFHAMWSLGAGIGAGLGSLLAFYEVGFKNHFSLISTIIFVLALSAAFVPFESQKNKKEANSPFISIPKGSLLPVATITFFASLSEGAVADWSAIFLKSVASLNDGNAALGFTVFSVCMFSMRLLGDRISFILGPATAARYSGLVALTGSIILLVSDSFLLLLLGFGLIGLGIAVIIPLAFSRAGNDETISQGTAIASIATLGYGGMLLGPLFLGLIAEITSIKTSFLILPIMAFFIFILSKHLSIKSEV
ncbi:MFS transporter [Pseudothioglobus sp. nBUS_23]|uniref:MFS transporter n=1 Tax=Pseudothioglobus sp. nBUS_23 TaxID=3395318 RepID=UPI003EBF0781